MNAKLHNFISKQNNGNKKYVVGTPSALEKHYVWAMRIRRANINDLEELYALYAERFESQDAASIRYSKVDWQWYLTYDRTIILVLENEGEMVGFSFTYDMGVWAYMEHIVVKSSWRSKGCAKRLMEELYLLGQEKGWRILEACYYSEIEEMGIFMKKIGWEDGGITTRWVYREVS